MMKADLLKRKQLLEKVISAADMFIAEAPEGSLRVNKSGKRRIWQISAICRCF